MRYGTGAPTEVHHQVVAAEAVPLELPPAGIGYRIVSGLLDVVVYLLIGALLMWGTFRLFLDTDEALFAAMTTLVLVVALVAIPTAVQTVTGGKSLGHWALGLRTVRDDAGPVGFRHALTRSLIGVVELFVFAGIPAFVAALATKRTKRFGDLLAGTYVIRDRQKLDPAVPEPVPPGLADWAAAADLATLPDDLALTIRRYVLRRTELAATGGPMLARRLLRQAAPYVSPAPPPAPDDLVLVAILAERRRRSAAQLAAEAELRHRLLG